MSQCKKDQLFPVELRTVSDSELAKFVAVALRQDFGGMTSVVKQIGKLTDANLRTIKNWYEARNAPSSGHLLLLARASPSILKFVLMQVGGKDLWDSFRLFSNLPTVTITKSEEPVLSNKYDSGDVRIMSH